MVEFEPIPPVWVEIISNLVTLCATPMRELVLSMVSGAAPRLKPQRGPRAANQIDRGPQGRRGRKNKRIHHPQHAVPKFSDSEVAESKVQ